jgi:NAD(P)-dependent dehydrogenase (short-subunit alcohol dehydrogenase family)
VREPERLVPVGFVDRLFRLDGQVALVTGGASGLGAAIAAGLGQAGARIVLADIDLAGAQAYAAQLTDLAEPPLALPVDVTRRDSVDGLVASVVARLGRIDVLVQSAGTSARNAAETFPEEEWDRIVAVNLKGSFLVAQAVGRQMLAQRAGAIVNIASIGASVAYPHSTAYLQSKGGVAQLTRSLALEWIDRGVRVNAIAPSLFDTPLSRAADARTSLTSEFILTRTPIGRRGHPREVVGAAIFLASAAASMVTGHILQVDGGYLCA